MSLDDETLTEAAQHGELDYTKWPAIVEPLLQRLNYIAHHEFPFPRPYPSLTPNVSTSSDSAQNSSGPPGTTLVSQTPTTPRTLPPVPPFPGSASSTSHVPNSQPEPSHTFETFDSDRTPTSELPLALSQLLDSITNTLRSSFSSRPPHTVQRLAELILYPRHHYRTLPAYLRALDRVVSVSSSADIFPLSEQYSLANGITNRQQSGGLLWKNDTNGHDKTRDNELGSDESLGGALLTPIPWLRDVNPVEKGDSDHHGIGLDTDTELLEPLPDIAVAESGPDTDQENTTVATDGSAPGHATTALTPPHHDPLVPERQDGAVTQGELIRMEQEAGVVPVKHSSQSNPIRTVGRSDPIPHSIALGVGIGLDDLEDDEAEDGIPHARGPDVVGTVDMGLVGGRDVRLRIGSPPLEGISEHHTIADVNDAQSVAAGSTENNATTQRKHSPSEDSYVDVGGELDTGDEMQIDSTESSTTNLIAKHKSADEDEDIVLVDADSATETERAKP